MGPLRIIKAVDVAPEGSAAFRDIDIGSQIHLLVFDRAPKPFDKDIVPPGGLAIHANRDFVF